jgi:hypothetical protein
MIINFRAREISRGIYKLIKTVILIIIKNYQIFNLVDKFLMLCYLSIVRHCV